jgi:hypothetical protein
MLSKVTTFENSFEVYLLLIIMSNKYILSKKNER